jgi:hypothetical protein
VPAGTIFAAVAADRLIYDVRPSWEPTANAQLWKMLDIGLKYNLIPGLPEKEAIQNAHRNRSPVASRERPHRRQIVV